MKVVKVAAAEAEVRTEAFWCPRLWSPEKRKNAFVYSQRHFHKYLFVRDADQWLIDYDIYPAAGIGVAEEVVLTRRPRCAELIPAMFTTSRLRSEVVALRQG